MGSRGPISNKRRRAASAATAGGQRIRELPDDALAMFRRLVKENDQLRPADAAMVEQMVQAALLARWAFAELAKAGPDGSPHNLMEQDTTHGDGTEMRRHPMWIAWRTASEQLRAAAQQLGATPMARARMPEPEIEQLSLADVLFGDAMAHAPEPAVVNRDE